MTICHFLFCPTDAAGDKKRAAPRDWRPLARGSGHGYYLLLRKSFLTGSRKIAHKFGYLLPRPRGGLKTATRALVKELVPLARTRAVAAAFGVFSRLEVTHVNFLFLLFAHITFLSCVFGFGLCSRRIVAVPLRPSRLGSGRPHGSAYLSNASAVELHAPQNLRPSFLSTDSQAPY